MLTESQAEPPPRAGAQPEFSRASRIRAKAKTSDKAAGLLADCGKPMPFIDRVVFTIEKEKIPHKTKFMQGYYDNPEISPVRLVARHRLRRQELRGSRATVSSERGIQMPRTLEISNWYLGFNWWDPVVGKGKTPEQQVRNRKLRQALSIAIDWEEFVRVFESKAAGEPAMSPVPPGRVRVSQGSDQPRRLRRRRRQAAP